MPSPTAETGISATENADPSERTALWQCIAAVLLMVLLFQVYHSLPTGWSFATAVITEIFASLLGITCAYLLLRRDNRLRAERDRKELIEEMRAQLLRGIGEYTREERGKLVQEVRSTALCAMVDSSRFADSGIRCVHQALPGELIASIVRGGCGELKLMSTWFTRMAQIHKMFEFAGKHNSSVKILLMNPECEFADERGRDVRQDPDHVRREIWSSITSIRHLSQTYGVNTELRVYRGMPSLQIYIFGKVAFVGYPWRGDPSTSHTQLEVDISDLEKSYFGQEIVNEFATMWERSDLPPAYPPVHGGQRDLPPAGSGSPPAGTA